MSTQAPPPNPAAGASSHLQSELAKAGQPNASPSSKTGGHNLIAGDPLAAISAFIQSMTQNAAGKGGFLDISNIKIGGPSKMGSLSSKQSAPSGMRLADAGPTAAPNGALGGVSPLELNVAGGRGNGGLSGGGGLGA